MVLTPVSTHIGSDREEEDIRVTEDTREPDNTAVDNTEEVEQQHEVPVEVEDLDSEEERDNLGRIHTQKLVSNK